MNHNYKTSKRKIINGHNPFTIQHNDGTEELMYNFKKLFHCICHTSYTKKRIKWVKCIHQWDLQKHLGFDYDICDCPEGCCTCEYNRHPKEIENDKWREQNIVCSDVKCRIGDSHFAKVKYCKLRLRPFVLAMLYLNECKWHLLEFGRKHINFLDNVDENYSQYGCDIKRRFLSCVNSFNIFDSLFGDDYDGTPIIEVIFSYMYIDTANYQYY